MSRRVAFALLVTASVVLAVGYAAWAVRRSQTAGRAEGGGPVATGDAAAARAILRRSLTTVMFRSEVEGPYWAQVALVPSEAPDAPRTILPLKCRRLHYAAGRGLCLTEEGSFVPTYHLYVFGPDFQVLHKVTLSGLPSRARVSPDGRYGATTVFVSGHSYADASFSTETVLMDLASGAKLGNLEGFAVSRDGQPFKSVDFNFWGVTFAADGNRFYATLSTRGQTYLVEGDIAARRMQVLRANVECPSLSPDGTRIAFKKRIRGGLAPAWRFYVLALATMTETPMAEPRSVDDQIEWLDDHQLLYEIAPDLWSVPADGSGEPRTFIRRAVSPAVIRTAMAPSRTPAPRLSLPSTDVSVALAATPDPARVGQELSYIVTVNNRGPVAASDLGIDVHLAPNVTFGTLGRPSPPDLPYGCSVLSGYVSCKVNRLAMGETWTLPFTVVPKAPGSVRMRVTVHGPQPDPVPGNDSAAMQTAVLGRQD
jgi:uncharacterized repeat protein (TIGR01451 family)